MYAKLWNKETEAITIHMELSITTDESYCNKLICCHFFEAIHSTFWTPLPQKVGIST